MRLRFCQLLVGFFSLALVLSWCAGRAELAAQDQPAAKFPEIKRLLPPEGIEIPEVVEKRLRNELEAAYKRYEPLKEHELAADIEVFLKAVKYALDLREFYTAKDFAKADTLLKETNERITQLAAGKHPWTTATGLVVRGYRSTIDDSAQPYGVVVPAKFDFKQKIPLYVWLHGRGDKATDLHFIHERMTKPGQITPPNAIVVHAFGRQCVGFQNAGEVDVLEATQHARGQYGTNPTRNVLIGFSMGGAGAWHVGAHFASQFQVIAPGAGYAETARYQKLKPEDYPPWYEQKLWGQNDTPAYVRNLFNTKVIAYSGELDRQIQAARVMEEAYEAEGEKLTHLIGPKTEHKYEPKTLIKLLSKIDQALQKSSREWPKQVSLQTRTLDYPQQYWVRVEQLEEHWQDTRVEAALVADVFEVKTKNVARLALVTGAFFPPRAAIKIKIDGQDLVATSYTGAARERYLEKVDGKWGAEPGFDRTSRKMPNVQGPIDDAFTRPFVVVTPSKLSKNPRFQAWMEFELAHFRARWRALMRADFVEKRDSEVTADDRSFKNLILWGDADSNSVIRELESETMRQLPIVRRDGQWVIGERKYDAATHVPVFIYPYDDHCENCIVLNSGLTFREAHDRTNSLQNPKLPDWAVIDITQLPDATAPGKVVNAGFFDEEWKLKPGPK